MAVFSGVWDYGQRLMVVDESSPKGREFRGFLTPLGGGTGDFDYKSMIGAVSKERFLLVAEPEETFPHDCEARVVFGGRQYTILGIREIYVGEALSHREALLYQQGEVIGGA